MGTGRGVQTVLKISRLSGQHAAGFAEKSTTRCIFLKKAVDDASKLMHCTGMTTMNLKKMSATQKQLLVAKVEKIGGYYCQGYKGAESALYRLGYIKSEYIGNICKTWVTEAGMAAYNAIKGVA